MISESIAKIESCRTFLQESQKKIKDTVEAKFSSKDLSAKYETKVESALEATGFYLPLAKLLTGTSKYLLISLGSIKVEQSGEVKFKQPAHLSIEFKDWLFVYNQKCYDSAGAFLENLKKAMVTFKIKVAEPEWVEVVSLQPLDWVKEIENHSPEKKQFVLVFMNGPTDRIYKEIKSHSLIKKGYITQGVKEYTSKKGLSIASKVGLQINAKLGGATYIVDFPK